MTFLLTAFAQRNFRFTSILSFVALAMGTWEVILSATAAGLTNGGTGGMVWMFVGSYFCFGSIVLSLAEMSSMCARSFHCKILRCG